MLNINVQNMRTAIEELKNLIETYEENSMTVAYELKNTEPNWHDDNSPSFFEKIHLLKNQLSEFISDMDSVKTTYQYIIEEIRKIENGINILFSDSSKEKNIIAAYNNAINKASNAKYKINSLSIGFCSYYEQRAIRNEITRINNIQRDLERSKNNVINMFRKLSDLEMKINASFAKLKMDYITEIDYSQYQN